MFRESSRQARHLLDVRTLDRRVRTSSRAPRFPLGVWPFFEPLPPHWRHMLCFVVIGAEFRRSALDERAAVRCCDTRDQSASRSPASEVMPRLSESVNASSPRRWRVASSCGPTRVHGLHRSDRPWLPPACSISQAASLDRVSSSAARASWSPLAASTPSASASLVSRLRRSYRQSARMRGQRLLAATRSPASQPLFGQAVTESRPTALSTRTAPNAPKHCPSGYRSNWRRPHGSLNHKPPGTRLHELNNLLRSYS